MLGPFLINFISYVKTERGNRGLPWNFLINPLYWQSKLIKPQGGGLKMKNICVIFDKKEKNKASRSILERIFKGKNFVLKGFDLDLKDK